LSEHFLERLRKQEEKCDNLEGFFFMHSINSGTGSGFWSSLISHDFGKKAICNFTIFPSANLSNAIVEPYNAVLGLHSLIESSNLTFILENEALYNIATNKILLENPTYSNINKLIAQSFSSLTAGIRFRGALNYDLTDLLTNLTIYHRLHFIIPSYSPFVPKEQEYHRNLSITEITNQIFDVDASMAKCNKFKFEEVYAACLLYRGDVSPSEIYPAIDKIKKEKTIKFSERSPNGFKIGVCDEEPSCVPEGELAKVRRSAALFTNSTAVEHNLERIVKKFDALWNKKAFVHWFNEAGVLEDEFNEARENLYALIKDYEIEYDPGEP